VKIAVTGGTGFIGRPLVEALLARGHGVRVLSRSGSAAVSPSGATAGFFDAGKPVEAGALNGVEALIHLAGETISSRWTRAYKETLTRSRVDGTRALAAALAGTGVRTWISASAIGYYGPRDSEPLDESATPGTDFLAQLCASWEAAADPARASGVRVVHPRIGVVLHPDGGALRKMLPPFRMGVGGRMGTGQQWMSWIHRADLISLLVSLVEHDAMSGPVNATAPNPVTNGDFTQALAGALHRPAVLPAPSFALKLALGEMSSLLLTGQRVLPEKALAAGFVFTHPSLPDALAHLLGGISGATTR
jgi:uncharacterized protein